MAGFGKAFSDAFDKSYPASTTAAVDIVKETLKDAQKSADEKHKSESVRNAIIAAAAQSDAMNGDKNLTTTKQYSKIVDAMGSNGDSLEGLKLIHGDLINRIKASTRAQQQQQNTMLQQGMQPVTPATPADPQSAVNVGGRDYAPVPGFESPQMQTRQDRLEKNYTNSLEKVVSFRSGGLGLQDTKVNQAIDLRTLADQYYDPKTGNYNIPPTKHYELALGVAKLLSPSGNVGEAQANELRQKTAKEGLAKTLIFLGADPKLQGGPTQPVIQDVLKTIDREGQVSEDLRDKYLSGLKKLVPAGLDPANAERLSKTVLTSSFRDYLQNSPSNQFEYKTVNGQLMRRKKSG